jgi:hypothetical protein
MRAPFESAENSKSMMPVYHLLKLYSLTIADPRTLGAMYELEVLVDFPTTILLPGIPLAMI